MVTLAQLQAALAAVVPTSAGIAAGPSNEQQHAPIDVQLPVMPTSNVSAEPDSRWLIIGDGILASTVQAAEAKKLTFDQLRRRSVLADLHITHREILRALRGFPRLPSGAILSFGTVNIEENATARRNIREFDEIVRALAERNVTEIFVVPPILMTHRQEAWQEYVNQLRAYVPPRGVQFEYWSELEALVFQTGPTSSQRHTGSFHYRVSVSRNFGRRILLIIDEKLAEERRRRNEDERRRDRGHE
ncbi:hypothetical protein U1Q18_048631 [Sarracenia purpurea var. burkii]